MYEDLSYQNPALYKVDLLTKEEVMDCKRRGMRCGLSNQAINELLRFLLTFEGSFYIPWQLAIESKDMILPQEAKDVLASKQYIKTLAEFTIWELELHIYPRGASPQSFELYEDFWRSPCICCLIYYDCGWLDMYVKDDTLFKHVHSKLIHLHAEDLEILTVDNDSREALHL